ncbi:MAG: porin [Pseudomonadales bacterium]|nr:porin [Pseudomonadales bacterium]
MKKLAFAFLGTVAVAGVTSTSVNAAGSVDVYGKVNATFNNYDDDYSMTGAGSTNIQDTWKVESNASRLGFKGKYDLGERTMAVFKLEYEVDPTQDAAGDGGSDFKQRNTYAGISNKDWGTVIAGRHDTPMKSAQGKIDLFNDLPYGDIKYVLVGEERINNIVMYSTPEMGGFSANVMFAPGEGTGKNADDGIADHMSVSVGYEAEDFWVTLAQDSDVKNSDVTRVAAGVDIGDFGLGFLVQRAEGHDNTDMLNDKGLLGPNHAAMAVVNGGLGIGAADDFDESRGAMVSASYKIGDVKLKAQYTKADYQPTTAGWSDTEAKMMSFGADYKLTKQAKLFAYVSQIDYDVTTGAATSVDYDYSTAAVGWEFKF